MWYLCLKEGSLAGATRLDQWTLCGFKVLPPPSDFGDEELFHRTKDFAVKFAQQAGHDDYWPHAYDAKT